MWLIGGFAGEETNDILRFDLEGEKWTRCPSEWLRPRSVSASFSLGGAVFGFGGEVSPSDRGHEGAGGFAGDIFAIDATTGEPLTVRTVAAHGGDLWAPTPADGVAGGMPPPRGWGGATSISKSQAILFGGLTGDDASPVRLDDTWLISIRLQAMRAW